MTGKIQKKRVIIRDDDVSFFTDPEMLNQLYGELFERSIPVCLSVIPNVSCSAKSSFKVESNNEYEPFIPDSKQGKNERFALSENTELIQFIESNNNIFIAQHGYTHAGLAGNSEFDIRVVESIVQLIKDGQSILKDSFGTIPEVFVPPHDSISREGLEVVTDMFKVVSIRNLSRRHFHWSNWPDYYLQKYNSKKNTCQIGDANVYSHPGCLISGYYQDANSIEKISSYLEKNDLLVLVLHHWEFFTNGTLNQKMYKKLYKSIKWLEEQDVLFDRFV